MGTGKTLKKKHAPSDSPGKTTPPKLTSRPDTARSDPHHLDKPVRSSPSDKPVPTSPPQTPLPGRGTARGWTFISTGLSCWWQFALRYIVGLVPVSGIEHFDFGTVFHALLEGVNEATIRAWGVEFAQHVDLAKALVKYRMEQGTVMGEAVEKEKKHTILKGAMTSRPDRVEGHGKTRIMRDFKSAAFFSKWDQEWWDVNGGILGELIASGAEKALVDVTRKGASPAHVVYEVRLTAEKKRALLATVDDFWNQLAWRLEQVRASNVGEDFAPFDAPADLVRSAFPRNLNGCVNKYGLCPFYNRCWTRGATTALYKEVPLQRWWTELMSDRERRVLAVAVKRSEFE